MEAEKVNNIDVDSDLDRVSMESLESPDFTLTNKHQKHDLRS